MGGNIPGEVSGREFSGEGFSRGGGSLMGGNFPRTDDFKAD